MAKKQLRTKLLCRRGIYQLAHKSVGADKWTQFSLKTSDPDEAESKRQAFVDSHVSSRQDQIAILEAQLALLKDEQVEEEVQESLRLDNVWSSFINSSDYNPISDATMGGYIGYWKGRTGLLPFMQSHGITSLADFDSASAGDFLKYLTGESVGRATQGKYITFFRRLWNVVAPQIESPWKNKRGQGSGGKVKKKPFTIEQQRKIINHIGPYFDNLDVRGMPKEEREQAKIEYKALHIILAYTGLRLVDACQLTIGAVFFDRGVIEVIPQKTKHRGDDPMYAKIGIHPTLGMILRTLLKGRSSGYFLPYLAAEYDRDQTSVSKRIQRQIKDATGLECAIKMPGRARSVAVYGAHSHRKSISDRMRENGVDIMVRMQILGHKDSRSETQDYSHVTDKEVQTAVNSSMPDLLKKADIMEVAG